MNLTTRLLLILTGAIVCLLVVFFIIIGYPDFRNGGAIFNDFSRLWATLLVAGVVWGGVTLLLLARSVLKPINQLFVEIENLSAAKDITARLPVEGSGEDANLGYSINGLLDEFQKQSLTLEKRLAEMRTAADISRSISAVLDQAALFQQVVDTVRERFDLYYVGLFMVDDTDEYAVLKAGSGDAGKQMMNRGHRLAVGNTSMVGWAIAHKQPSIALDVGLEPYRFNNPFLPLTRSELALPLQSGNRVFGALTVQSDQPSAFGQEDITILQNITDSLAISLDNARLFQQVQEHLEEIRSLHKRYLAESWVGISRKPELASYVFENTQAFSADDQSSSINAPLTLRGQTIGQITLEGGARGWSEEEKAFIEAVATEAASAMENARLMEEIQRHAQEERIVNQITSKTQSSLDLETVMRNAVIEIGRAKRASKVRIRLQTDETRL